MPNYLYNSNWPDAARYGEGLANTLNQALIQLPQQKAQMAMQLASMQQQAQQRNALLGLQQQREADVHSYHVGELDRQRQRDADAASARAMMEQIALLKAQIDQQRATTAANKPLVIPGVGIVSPNSLGGMPKQQPGTNAMPQQQGNSGLGQTAIPGLGTLFSLPQNPRSAIGAQNALEGRLTGDLFGSLSSTNQAIRDFGQTNTLPRLLQLQQGQQMPQAAPSWRWNPATGQLEQ